ncbi:MAG: sodium:solute symporter family protein [Calditrichaeota bacterium]|nr:sodium:solute symporter family protein [Calditrichota bacterium]
MFSENSILSTETGFILLAIISVVWIVLGYIWGKKVTNIDSFMLAGRNVGFALGTATAVATWITSNTTMLAPQFALELGIWGMIAYSTASFGLFLFAPMARRIKKLMPNGYTSGDFIRLRYGKKAWYMFLVISIFYGLTWLISMAMAGGILMNTIAGIPYKIGMTVILFVCVSYTLFGGLFGVIGTDYIQSLIILIGVVFIGYSVLDRLDIPEVYANLQIERPMLLSILLPASIMAFFNNMLFGFGEIFHSNVWWSRVFAMRKEVGAKAYTLAGFIWFPIPIAAGFIALSTDTLGLNITSPDMVGPMVATYILGKVGAIIVFIVLFSSLASSIDSLLAATSDLLTQDFYKKIINPQSTDKQQRRVSSLTILSIGLFAWLVSLPKIGTLATVLFFAGPLVASTIWPIITGLYWKTVNRSGAFAAMLCGSLVGLIAYFELGWYTASLISAAVSMLVTLISTKLKPEDFNWTNLKE